MANIIFDGDIEYPPEYVLPPAKEEVEEKPKAEKKKAKDEEPKDE